jgi:DNA replication protein DnaC
MPDPTSADSMREQHAARTDERIPVRYRDAIADQGDVLRWLNQIVLGATERADGLLTITTGPSLLLLGPTGTGKTWQAYGTVRALAGRGIATRWEAVSAVDLYARLRPRYGVDSEAEFRTVANAGLLFLDDFGAAKASEWTEDINYRLINHRYERDLPTLIATNLVPGEFSAAFGDRVTSRLAQMCIRAALKGEDRRKKPQLREAS